MIQLLSIESRNVAIDHLASDAFVSSAIIRHGLIPCAPYSPTAAITISALEFYRIIHLRCPHISIQAFVKTICDLHCSPFKPYLSRQFSISFDLYLSIRRYVDEMVQRTLKRDTPDWRLRHVCPPCTYILEDEPKLQFNMLYTVDGNDSLKRIIRRETTGITDSSTTTVPILGNSSESADTRRAGNGLYLTNEQVDQWSTEMLIAISPTYVEDDTDQNPCAERWRNMRTELTAKMWGIFEETGLFLALCRHGFVLLLADMIRSGELYVYCFPILLF
jgi:hypothetical protein